MFLISIGTDRKIFEDGSPVQKRQVEYGQLFDAVHIIVWNQVSEVSLSEKKIAENVFTYPTNSRNKIFYIFDAIKIVRSILRKSGLRKDSFVVTTQDPFEVGLVGLVAKLVFGVKLHVQLHTDFGNKYFLLHSPLNVIRFLLAQVVLPYVDSIRCVSKKSASVLLEFKKPITIIPIRGNLYFDRQDLKKIFSGNLLTVSRLEKEKNLETAIEAFSLLCKDFKDSTFTIVGDGSERKNLELKADSLGVGDRVKFVGWQKNPEEFYKNSDVYISTSLYEGYGMSVVEAASYGLPLVLSDAGIAGEFFENKGAFICKPKDIKSFHSSLASLFKDENLVRQMGAMARESAESNSMEKEKYLELYKNSILLAQNSKIKNGVLGRFLDFILSVVNNNRIIRFVIAGGSVALSQILILYVLTEFAHIWYLFSSIFSFVYAVVASFILQKYWAFRDDRKERAFIQFLKFVVVAVIGIFINTSSMYFWVDIVGIWYVASQFITGFIIAVVNFLIYKFFIFNK